VSDGLATISELLDRNSKASHIQRVLNILIPHQIRSLRFASKNMSRQLDVADAVGMRPPRISELETPGAVNYKLGTLIKLASVFKVGLIVEFVPFDEMAKWENKFSQDSFHVIKLDDDAEH
jgi:transcriptional regulator with XRE-family HTH domain